MAYTQKVVDHFENPQNVGSLDKNAPDVGTGIVGAPACGDVMKLQLKISDSGIIEEAKFKTFGCGSAIASSSLITTMVKGITVDQAEKIKNSDIEISNTEKKIKKYIPLSKRQDKPDSALWLIKQHSLLKDSQIARLVGITKNSVTSIRNKSYWNYNNLNPKDPVALNLFTQKDLVEAIEKAERRIKREKKQREKLNKKQNNA